jgi:hypothetical protein
MFVFFLHHFLHCYLPHSLPAALVDSLNRFCDLVWFTGEEGLLEKSKLAQHAFEEGHKAGWDESRILEIERNSRYRK